MNELSTESLTTQLNTLLKAYSDASNQAGIETPLNIGTASLPITGDMANSLNTLGSLGDINKLTSMTQLPTTWSGIVNMLPKTGMFSMDAMIWSTIGTFVFLWLLWYSKERAKAKLWAKTFHKEARKFVKRYDEEKGGQEALLKSILGDAIAKKEKPAPVQIPTPQVTPQTVPPQSEITL